MLGKVDFNIVAKAAIISKLASTSKHHLLDVDAVFKISTIVNAEVEHERMICEPMCQRMKPQTVCPLNIYVWG